MLLSQCSLCLILRVAVNRCILPVISPIFKSIELICCVVPQNSKQKTTIFRTIEKEQRKNGMKRGRQTSKTDLNEWLIQCDCISMSIGIKSWAVVVVISEAKWMGEKANQQTNITSQLQLYLHFLYISVDRRFNVIWIWAEVSISSWTIWLGPFQHLMLEFLSRSLSHFFSLSMTLSCEKFMSLKSFAKHSLTLSLKFIFISMWGCFDSLCFLSLSFCFGWLFFFPFFFWFADYMSFFCVIPHHCRQLVAFHLVVWSAMAPCSTDTQRIPGGGITNLTFVASLNAFNRHC